MPSTWNNQASKLMRVLIIDDHPLYIKGLESLLFELDPGIETHGARTTEEALEIASVTTFHLVLLDLKLPGRKDLQALAAVKAVLDAIPIVVVSGNVTTAGSVSLGMKPAAPISMARQISSILSPPLP